MSRADPVVKLILLGNGSVGKTSIISRFTDDGFAKVYKQTVGLDFFEKLVTLRGEKRAKLQIWDIGGQSIGSKMLGKYVYGSDVVFLCYDVTDEKSFSDVEDWLRMVTTTFETQRDTNGGKKKPPQIYLCGNKIDLEHLRAASRTTRQLTQGDYERQQLNTMAEYMRDHRDSMRNFHNMQNIQVVWEHRPSSDSDESIDMGDLQLSPDSD